HNNIFQALFSPNGSQIINFQNKIARLWDISAASTLPSPPTTTTKTRETLPVIPQNQAQIAIFSDHKDIRKAVFSPDGRHILTTSIDRIPRLWDTKGNLLTQLQIPKEQLNKPEISPDGRHILAIGGQSVYLLDIKGNLIQKFVGDNNYSIISAVFSPDGSKVLTASTDDTARLWDIKGNLLRVFSGHQKFLRSAVFSPNGNQILTTSFDKTIRLWDINGNLLTVFQDNSDQIQFSPDGSHILTYMYYARRNARLWNTKGNLVTDFQEKQDADIPQTRIYSAVFSPNGRQILIARENGSVRLWDTQGKLLADLRGHDYRVNSAVFSSNGSQILTAGADKTARLWDNKGNLLAIFRGHEQEVNSAVFSPNGNQILTASSDKTARLWDISTGIKVSAAEVAFITGNQLASQGTVESRKLALLQLEEAAKLYHVDKNYRQAAS
ncbi:MAG: WD40 repeat domain-containing protein, partial [Sphaerospermopsis kisseleviana]